jgi:Tol biopolymer transport system component/predicted Ser/Thr protein kinase
MLGQTISHYKILEKLGEGGMGVVYQAQDTKLDRLVALKFLPQHLASSEADKARFVQEAKAASALNHPNVCTIHDIQEHDGQMFIVMEFVDGQTLRERKGSITFKQAVDIGIQIAEGLAAAHEKGIVHRDIKPDNIMIRRDGIAQIMDFGLAKLRGSVSRLTKEGSTVGTAGYMSPEQVQGLDADHRSDIFSAGVLLYELFTGQLPFKGVHETALLYEIVNVDAAPMSALKPDIDPELDRIVLECLDKDANERTQSAKQIAIDLKRFRRVSSRQHLSRVTAARPIPVLAPSGPADGGSAPGRMRTPRRELIAWGCVALLTAAVGVLLLRSPSADSAAQQRMYSAIVVPESIYIHSYGSRGGQPVLSPDGRTLAFTGILPDGAYRIFTRSLGEADVHVVAGTEDGSGVFWSPDGKYLGFFSDGRMRKVDLVGGSPATIVPVANPRGATWGPDGTIIYAPDYQSGLFRVTADGKGKPEPLTTLDSSRHEGSHRWPVFLPDGKHFLYLARTASETGEAEGDAVFVGSLDGGAPRLLVQSSYNAAFGGGYLLFARGSALMAQRFDPDQLALQGDPVKIQDGVLNDPSYNIAVFTVAQSGMLVFQSGQTQNGARPILVSRNGTILRPLGDKISESDQPRFSPDGKQVAFYVYDMRSRRSNIWLYDLRSDGRRRLTTRPGGDFWPVWSRDGSSIFFSSMGRDRRDIYDQSTSHSGGEQEAFSSSGEDIVRDVSPDGETLLVESTDLAQRKGDLWLVPSKGKDRKPVSFQTTRFNEQRGRFSRDGNWIAYVSDESGEDEIYVKKVSTPDADAWKVSSGGGWAPVWDYKTNELIYLNRENQFLAATLRYTATGVEVTSVKTLFRAPTFASEYDLSPDGSTFVIGRYLEVQKFPPLSLMTSWMPERSKK